MLEIGAGLGYVAHDAIERLRDAGRTVEYTIVELSPALAARADRSGSADAATWVIGDVARGAASRGGFDLILSNEMAGDLPARQLTRDDLGLEPDRATSIARSCARSRRSPPTRRQPRRRARAVLPA